MFSGLCLKADARRLRVNALGEITEREFRGYRDQTIADAGDTEAMVHAMAAEILRYRHVGHVRFPKPTHVAVPMCWTASGPSSAAVPAMGSRRFIRSSSYLEDDGMQRITHRWSSLPPRVNCCVANVAHRARPLWAEPRCIDMPRGVPFIAARGEHRSSHGRTGRPVIATVQ
jgi:hypothetical protein